MKSILLGSIVAAALVFGGCGSSNNSNSSDDKNPPSGKKDDNKTKPPKKDDNKTKKFDLTVGINGFYLPDNNVSDQTIVQKTWVDANKICQDHNGRLPELAELNASLNTVITLFTDHNISTDDNGKFTSVIWTSDKASDYNESDPDRERVYIWANGNIGSDKESPEVNASDHSFYFLCKEK